VVSGEDGCQELIEDTAEMQKAWIEKMMEKGLCSCDEEHMFDCPSAARGDETGVAKPSQADVEQQAFDDVLERILGEKVCFERKTRSPAVAKITDRRLSVAFKIIQNRRFSCHLKANICDLLSMINSNLGPILHRLATVHP